MVRRWWTGKYKLPPNHELYLNRTTGSLLQELFEDLHVRKDELQEDLKEAGGLERAKIIETIANIDKVLDDPKLATAATSTGDPFVDEWEKELSEGRMPDLHKGLPERLRRRQ